MDKYRRRDDGRIEKVCEHGIGHPISVPDSMGEEGYIHGCDGCCKNWDLENELKDLIKWCLLLISMN